MVIVQSNRLNAAPSSACNGLPLSSSEESQVQPHGPTLAPHAGTASCRLPDTRNGSRSRSDYHPGLDPCPRVRNNRAVS
jgi:hypothetical protein